MPALRIVDNRKRQGVWNINAEDNPGDIFPLWVDVLQMRLLRAYDFSVEQQEERRK